MKHHSSRTIVFPHLILLIEGRLFLLILVGCEVYFIYLLINSIGTSELLYSLILAIMFLPLEYFVLKRFWPLCFGELVVTDSYVKFKGMFMHSCTLCFDDIKYICIRQMGNENVVKYDLYNTGFMYLLMSARQLPNIPLEKITNSKDVIKFQVTPRICAKLAQAMPSKYSSMFLRYAAKQGNVGSKVTKAAAGALKSVGKYFGNVIGIVMSVINERTKR